MPRPQKAGIDYFPLDVNFFSADNRIKILKARFGADGITIFIYLLCEIYRAGYFMRFDEDALFVVSDDLSMSPDKVKQVLNFLLERSLFDNILFQSDKVLTSTGIQRRFQLAVKERAKKNPIEIKDFWLLSNDETEPFIKVNCSLNNSHKNNRNSGKNDDNSRELSLKESKVKESKVNKDNSSREVVSDPALNRVILDFIDFRKKIKRPLTDHALELLIKKLDGMTQDQKEKVEILNQSIMNGWIGIFPLKGDKKGQPKQSGAKNQFHNFEQRDTDYDALVQKQLKGRLGGGQ